MKLKLSSWQCTVLFQSTNCKKNIHGIHHFPPYHSITVSINCHTLCNSTLRNSVCWKLLYITLHQHILHIKAIVLKKKARLSRYCYILVNLWSSQTVLGPLHKSSSAWCQTPVLLYILPFLSSPLHPSLSILISAYWECTSNNICSSKNTHSDTNAQPNAMQRL